MSSHLFFYIYPMSSDNPNVLDQPILSFNNFVKLFALAGALYIQNQSLKTAIHDEVVGRLADQKVIEARLNMLEGKQSFMPLKQQPQVCEFIAPAAVQIKPYRFKIYKLRNA